VSLCLLSNSLRLSGLCVSALKGLQARFNAEARRTPRRREEVSFGYLLFVR
jgi:hypothetical protein